MTHSIYLSYGGTSYYLSANKNTHYTGSGTPWTAQATTPYKLALNDKTGSVWTPQASVGQPVFGAELLFRTYDRVTETLGLQLYATTHDNAVALLRQLRQILNTARFDTPCLLVMQPDGASNAVYYQIHSADIQESADFIGAEAGNVTAGRGIMRCTVTWTRSAAGSPLSTTNAINGTTFTNNPTAGSPNTVSLGALAGDLIREGQPLNVRLATPSGGLSAAYIAVVASRVYRDDNSSATTSGTATLTDLAGVSWPDIRALRGVKCRVMARVASTSYTGAAPQLRLDDVFAPITQTRAVGVDGACLVDLGPFNIQGWRTVASTPTVLNTGSRIRVVSPDGGSKTVTLDYLEVLFYYTFLRVVAADYASPGVDIITSSDALVVEQHRADGTSRPSFACQPRVYGVVNSSNALKALSNWRGQLPRAYSGASLYAAWVTGSLTHTTAHTAAVTAEHLPQYLTLRGGG